MRSSLPSPGAALFRGAIHDAVQRSLLARNFFHGDGADAGFLPDIDQLARSRAGAGNDDVAQEHGERLVADQFAGGEHGVAESERFFLARVAELDRLADRTHQFGLVLLALALEKALELGGGIEMVFDGVLAAAGDDDDVVDAGGDALLDDVLDERLIDDRAAFPWAAPWWPAGNACPGRQQEAPLCERACESL